jgi:hypothetical protein
MATKTREQIRDKAWTAAADPKMAGRIRATQAKDSVTMTLDELAKRDERIYRQGFDAGKAENLPPPHHFEVNVSRLTKVRGSAQYLHFFATHERSITSAQELAVLKQVFDEKFPSPEYSVSISAKYEFGTALDAK